MNALLDWGQHFLLHFEALGCDRALEILQFPQCGFLMGDMLVTNSLPAWVRALSRFRKSGSISSGWPKSKPAFFISLCQNASADFMR